MLQRKITRRGFTFGGIVLGVAAMFPNTGFILPRTTVAKVTENSLDIFRDSKGEIIQLGNVMGREDGNKGFYYTVSSPDGDAMPVSKKPEQWRLAKGETVTWWLITPEGEQKVCCL